MHVTDYVNRWGEDAERSLQLAHELAQKAVLLDEAEPQAHAVLGIAYLWLRRHEGAIAEAERAIALDPNFAVGHVVLGHVLHYVGRSAEAVERLGEAMRCDPYHPDVYLHFLGQAYAVLGRYEDVIATLGRRLVRNPDTDVSRVLLAACYGHLGRTEEARAMWDEALRINPDYSLEHRRQVLPYKDPAELERVFDGLRKAGLPV